MLARGFKCCHCTAIIKVVPKFVMKGEKNEQKIYDINDKIITI